MISEIRLVTTDLFGPDLFSREGKLVANVSGHPSLQGNTPPQCHNHHTAPDTTAPHRSAPCGFETSGEELCASSIHSLFTDKPGKPGTPEVKDSDKDFIEIQWDPPLKDGGAPITGYNVERKDPRTGRWVKVNKEPVQVSSDARRHLPRWLPPCDCAMKASLDPIYVPSKSQNQHLLPELPVEGSSSRLQTA